jgi:hypothetical protein
LIKPIPQVELPREKRKKELGKELADSEHFLLLDHSFRDIVWRIRYMNPGYQQDRAIEQFWIQVCEDHQPEDGDSLQLRGFIFNDFLHALDELHELEAPHVEWTHHRGGTCGTLGCAEVARIQMGLPRRGAPESVPNQSSV